MGENSYLMLLMPLVKNWHMTIVASFLIAICIGFIYGFVIPAMRLSKELSVAIASLTDIRAMLSGNVVELHEIESRSMASPGLANLWREYAKTLHEQRKDEENGQSRIVCWRATALAESFFSDQAVVDARLKTEFYKHLPGILTGLGIIGTFLGLIIGLRNFKIPPDIKDVQIPLEHLIQSVGDAFYVSAAAIMLAMLFTWIEKALVSGRYRQVEKLRELVDSLFKSGAGEEYLDRLVTAAETSATQAAQIKDALVVELKEFLTTLAAQQIEAQGRQTGQISADVGMAISTNLGPPIEAIAKAVQGVTAERGEAVNKLLTDVLLHFSDQMRELFGGQMQGVSDLLRETSELMKATAVQFGQLAANINAAGTSTVDAMGEKLSKVLDGMEARQQILNSQMSTFVEQIRASVGQSQSESAHKLQEVLASVGEQVASVVAELRKQAEASAESQGQRQERFESTIGAVIGSLSNQMERLLTNLEAAGTNTVDSMGEKLGKALDSMDARQSALNTQMAAFVDQINALVGESQTESSRKLQEVLANLGAQVAGVVAELRSQAEGSAESQGERQERFENVTGAVIGSLSEQMERLLGQSVETNKSLQNTVARLAGATDKAIADMNSGAETLFVAASDFARAGQGVSDTMKASTVAVEAIKGASSQLTLATEGARGLFADYGKTRDTFALMVTELKQIVENARREASMTSEIIGKIEAAATQLGVAHKESEEYLSGVSEVLVKAHASFSENVSRTMRESNGAFQNELSSAVQLLSGAIKNLGDTIDDLPPRG